MPAKQKKVSKKEQLRIARLEAWAESQRREREALEGSESAGREHQSLLEQLAWSELMRLRLAEYADPAAQLSIPLATHRFHMLEWQAQQSHLQEVLYDARQLQEHTTKAKECLEEELREIRTVKRAERDDLQRRVAEIERHIKSRLDEVIEKTMTDIAEEQSKAQQLWNQDIELTRRAYLRTLHEIKLRVSRLTEQLQESKALHSNLPRRIRQLLGSMEPGELLMMIDTLSFEPEVLQYFMFRFPPAPDLPYGPQTTAPRVSAVHGLSRARLRATTPEDTQALAWQDDSQRRTGTGTPATRPSTAPPHRRPDAP
eukprot:TRINITY_DN10265_c0_g1_i1.p1 TRINITY_DN10265_c0_g1~~TRINITY_DN10265_c0_g1_i1.p1  ORF type:complete len:343 (+),score=104.64 TRINITY_DN10265_c0_g1_i1:90-1031(+)